MNELDCDLVGDSLPQLGTINKNKPESGCRNMTGGKRLLFWGYRTRN